MGIGIEETALVNDHYYYFPHLIPPTKYQCSGQVSVNFTQSRVIWEEKTSKEKMSPSAWYVGESVGHFFD